MDKVKRMYVCFYVTRSETGTPDQFWADKVYLTDHWEIFDDKPEAVKRYEKLIAKNEVHSAGVAEMDKEFRTDWF